MTPADVITAVVWVCVAVGSFALSVEMLRNDRLVGGVVFSLVGALCAWAAFGMLP